MVIKRGVTTSTQHPESWDTKTYWFLVNGQCSVVSGHPSHPTTPLLFAHVRHRLYRREPINKPIKQSKLGCTLYTER